MKSKQENEELQSRREFFKKAAKGAMPFLALGVFGPSFLTSCGGGDDEKKNPEDGNNSNGSGGNSNSIIGTWVGSTIVFIIDSDNGGTFSSYNGSTGVCSCVMSESNKGILTWHEYDPFNGRIYYDGNTTIVGYFTIDGNRMYLYPNSDYTGSALLLTKEGSNNDNNIDDNNGGGNSGGSGCSDCSNSCSNGCGDGCSNACYASCSVQCVGSCNNTCSSSCTGSCTGVCSTGCSGSCQWGCKGKSRL